MGTVREQIERIVEKAGNELTQGNYSGAYKAYKQACHKARQADNDYLERFCELNLGATKIAAG